MLRRDSGAKEYDQDDVLMSKNDLKRKVNAIAVVNALTGEPSY